MSEIEKMYENAGLSNMWVARYNDGYYEHERYYNSYKEMIRNMMKANDWTLTEAQEVAKRECKKEHPPFTAEKQLKILCFIVNNKHSVTFHDQIFGGDKLTSEKIQENLAWAINRIWQDLTEEEKASIKNILEM